MFIQLTDDLLDLVSSEIGRGGPRLAVFLPACCSCCCCGCIVNCGDNVP